MRSSEMDSTSAGLAAPRRTARARGRLVIGYGNVLRGDDGVGPAIADRLRDRVGERSDLTIRSAHQLLPEMADELARVGLAVSLDACVDQPAGSLRWRRLKPDPTPSESLGHQQLPERLLELTRLIHGRTPRAVVARIGAGSLEVGEGLTPPVEHAADLVVDRLAPRLTSDANPLPQGERREEGDDA